MFSFLSGIILNKTDDAIIVLVNNTGYEVFVPSSVWQQVSIDDPIEIYTHLHVREDTQALYGFTSLEERELFRKLISVSGIGPKSGIAALSAAPVNELIRAIQDQDHSVFQSVSGIGPKTAQRVVLELRSKFDDVSVVESGSGADPSASIRSDLIQAMEQLGYSPNEVHPVIRDLDLSVINLEEAVKEVLKRLQ